MNYLISMSSRVRLDHPSMERMEGKRLKIFQDHSGAKAELMQ